MMHQSSSSVRAHASYYRAFCRCFCFFVFRVCSFASFVLSSYHIIHVYISLSLFVLFLGIDFSFSFLLRFIRSLYHMHATRLWCSTFFVFLFMYVLYSYLSTSPAPSMEWPLTS